jgi:hypothetical protein
MSDCDVAVDITAKYFPLSPCCYFQFYRTCSYKVAYFSHMLCGCGFSTYGEANPFPFCYPRFRSCSQWYLVMLVIYCFTTCWGLLPSEREMGALGENGWVREAVLWGSQHDFSDGSVLCIQYTGILYNEFFSVPLNLFGCLWTVY